MGRRKRLWITWTNWLAISPKVGGGSGKLVNFQQHLLKKNEAEKNQYNMRDISLSEHLK